MPLFRRSRKATDPERQDEDLLLTRPAPAWSHFLGAEIIKKGRHFAMEDGVRHGRDHTRDLRPLSGATCAGWLGRAG